MRTGKLRLLNGAHRQRGTGLIEAIAAMVVLSIGCAAIFSWVAQSVSSLSKLQEQEQQLLMRLDAIDQLRDLNPMTQSSGKLKLSKYALDWRATPALAKPQELATGGLAGLYVVAVFNVSATLSPTDGSASSRITTTVAGFKKPPGGSGGMFDLAAPK